MTFALLHGSRVHTRSIYACECVHTWCLSQIPHVQYTRSIHLPFSLSFSSSPFFNMVENEMLCKRNKRLETMAQGLIGW